MEIIGGFILVLALFSVHGKPQPEPKTKTADDKKPKTKTDITRCFDRIFVSQPNLRVGQLITSITKEEDLSTITDEQFLSLLKNYENRGKNK